MKQFILLLCLVLVCSVASATHIRGGFITYTQDTGPNPNPRKFHFKLTLFTDRSSAADDPLIDINNGDGTTIRVPRASTTLIAHPEAEIEREEFYWEYTFGSNGTYTVSWNGINRNGGILNMAPPSDQYSQFIYTTLTVNSINGLNSSPQFLAPEPIIGSIGVAINYNLLAYDPDGDSLSYKLATPVRKDASGNTIPVPGYTFPGKTYSCGATTGDPVSVFSVDSKTGQLTWDAACRQGEYVVAIVVEEWRNGAKLGELVYDMQILTRFEPQSRIVFNNINELKFTQEGYVVAKANQELELKIYYMDLSPAIAPIPYNANDTTIISNYAGELTQLLNVPVSYTFESAQYGTIGIFRFTPDTTLIRDKPYFISFYGKKGSYIKTQSFGIKVRTDQPIQELLQPGNYPKTTEGHLIATTNSAIKLSMFAENKPNYVLSLGVESPLTTGAKQFDFAVRDTTEGKIGELIFQPSEAQLNEAPQPIIFKATYNPARMAGERTAFAGDPIVKELQIQVIVANQLPTATPEELAKAAYLIYPNQVQNRFTVQAEAPAIFSIYTLQGKLILEQQIQPGTTEVNRPNTNAGLYFYTLTTRSGQKTTGKLVLQ